MINQEIKALLFSLQDIKYRDFQSKLIPTVGKDYFIGVRTPELRRLSKLLSKREDINSFLENPEHEYFDELQLHAFIVSDIKDYRACIDEVNRFLPYVNNWATCDQMSPKVFKKHKEELLEEIYRWLESDKTYTVRFAVKMLMEHFLDSDFDEKYLLTVSKIRSEEYYVKMMVAWYFATALAKQYESAYKIIEDRRLDVWTHNRAIQKAAESYRISDKQKAELKKLKIKSKHGGTI
ncbi:MAG: DNA alkylation repair protein [Clostridia bacterium]|nr:DNA alkylation repair protein [Clostridia bacterium]